MNLNLLDKAIMYVAPVRGLARVRAKALSQVIGTEAGYDAAGKGRGNEWTRGAGTSQNAENRTALPVLRGRFRELARNNAYVAAAVDSTVTLTVGDGMQPVARGADPEKVKLAQELMLEWSKSLSCDADGQLDLYGLQAMMVRSECESGEGVALRKFARGKTGRIPLRIRVLEGDYIDHTRDGTIEGRRVVQGVAFDSDGCRVGYYLHRHHPGDSHSVRKGSQFVAATEIAHMYSISRPGQVRGVPRGASVATRVRNLDDFQDARLQQQKVAACLAAFVTQGEDGKTKGDVLPNKLEPSLLARLGPDEEVSYANPPSVSGQGDFITGEEHVIAKGFGLNHQILTGNISGANFSSTKIGRLDVYATVARNRRTMLVPQCCHRIADWFLEAADLAGYDLKGVTFDWVPPRSEILNLRDDIPALIRQARAGFGSLFAILRSLGYPDPKAVLKEIKEVNEFLDDNDIVLDTDPRKTTNGGMMQATASPAAEIPGEEVVGSPENDDDNGDIEDEVA